MDSLPEAGFRLKPKSIHWEPTGAPEVEAELLRSQYPPDAADVFLPLRFPDLCDLRLQGLLSGVLRRGVVRFEARLCPGEYELELGPGEPCRVVLEQDAMAVGRVELDCEGEGGPPLVRAVHLQFTPPLMIENVLQTLGQVQEVASHRRLAPLRSVISRRLVPRLPGWIKDLGGLAVSSADIAADVLLERVSARTKWRGASTLQFGFSGLVRWMDQVETRFNDVILPAAILPVPYAGLDRLLSENPLATADLDSPPDAAFSLCRTLLSQVAEVAAELSLEVLPPALRVKGTTIDGTAMAAEVRIPARLELQGSLSASVEGTDIHLQSDDLRLTEVGEGGTNALGEVKAHIGLDLDTPDLPLEERVKLEAELGLGQGSVLDRILVDLIMGETMALGSADVPLQVNGLQARAGIDLSWDGHQLSLLPRHDLWVSANLTSPKPLHIRDAVLEWFGEVNARVEGSLSRISSREWEGKGKLTAAMKSRIMADISPMPELDIQEGVISCELDSSLAAELHHRLSFRQANAFDTDLARTCFLLAVDQGEVEIEGRHVSIPPGTILSGELIKGLLSAAGLEDFALNLCWDMPDRCLLRHGEEEVSLFTSDLRSGQVTLRLDHTGKLGFSGDRHGLYGARYFNALLNPANEPEQLFDLLKSDDALSRVIAGISAFAPDLGEALTDLRLLLLTANQIFNREGIKDPKDLIPRDAICRTLSLLLTGDDRLQPRLTPVIKQVTDGDRLNKVEVRSILQEHLGDFDIDYELGAALNWLDLVVSPTEPVHPPSPVQEEPLALDPELEEARQGLPSARQIYAFVAREEVAGEAEGGLSPARLASLAPQLSRQQLEHLLGKAEADPSGWDPESLQRLRYVHEVKIRVEAIAEGYGGAEYGMQPTVIGTFLGEAVGPLPGVNCPAGPQPDEQAWPPPCALGPEEAAILLQAGQSTGRESKRTQMNNRLLLELMRSRPRSFTLAVMVEWGSLSSHALSGILYSFLDQDQDQMATDLNLVNLLSRKLDLDVPRKRHYMAGGRRAKESYYDALSRVAEDIIQQGRPYLARKQHLQVVRHPAPAPLALTPKVERLERQARQSIDRADDLGRACTFERDDRGGPRARARQAYGRAFRACARQLAKEPRAFQLPWFKDFWLRNEEALTVLSVVRGHQEDREDDRRWLRIWSGGKEVQGEQDLLQTVVRTLYWDVRHQQTMLADPLVRLLLDPGPGRYDFSIISCMGVITDGKDGAELEHAYRRLEERRGIRIHRAHTGIARSLEYNAERIIEAIQSCATPWGIIGYSQGCANALAAESMLRGGPPKHQVLLRGLVCRQLLFSAANGSPHGTSGMIKLHRALVLGERILKHYQAIYSREAVEAALRLAKAVLDSRLFVHILGGVHSLTFERALDLFRDGQFFDTVPTSYVCGVISEDRVPEALEFLFHVLNKITDTAPHDTQVPISDVIGRSTRVENAFTEAYGRCDMRSYPQTTHHWAPLTKEIEFVTTARDVEWAVYQSPKDRLVWPWVEVNARFGRISKT